MPSNALAALLFDAANPSEGPNIGAFVRAADGTLISATGSSLNVNLTSPIDVELNAGDGDSVQISDGTDTMQVNADGSINAVVSATDLDIRNLVFATDKVDVSGSSVQGDVADSSADSGNPVKVGSKAFNQASALSAITAGDRANLASDLYRRLFVNDSAAVGLKATKVAVTDAGESALPTSALPGRTRMLVKNMGPKIAYIGKAADAAANGYPLSKGESVGLEAGQAIALVAISEAGGTSELRVFELA